MTDWKPIETALRDGQSVILLYEKGAIEGRFVDGNWSLICGCEISEQPIAWMRKSWAPEKWGWGYMGKDGVFVWCLGYEDAKEKASQIGAELTSVYVCPA